jgi:hypothetical protein
MLQRSSPRSSEGAAARKATVKREAGEDPALCPQL